MSLYRVRLGQPTMELGEYQPISASIAEGVETGHRRRRWKKPSFTWALSKTVGATFMMGAVFKLANDFLTFANPQLLK